MEAEAEGEEEEESEESKREEGAAEKPKAAAAPLAPPPPPPIHDAHTNPGRAGRAECALAPPAQGGARSPAAASASL